MITAGLNEALHSVVSKAMEPPKSGEKEITNLQNQDKKITTQEMFQKIMEAAGLSNEAKLAAAEFIPANTLKNMGKSVNNYLKLSKYLGIAANGFSAGLTISDAYSNGVNPSHIADLGIQGVTIGLAFLPGVGPALSFLVGTSYFVYTSYFQSYHDGLTPTQYYLNQPSK